MASAAVTTAVLFVFALSLGSILADRLRADFANETSEAAVTLADSLTVTVTNRAFVVSGVDINDYAASQRAKVRIVDLSGGVIASSVGAPDFPILAPGESERDGYLIETRPSSIAPAGNVLVQYARPMADLHRSVTVLWLVLAVGVVGGAILALVAALAIARRTLRPLNDLTGAAKEVRRTADPGVSIPIPPANDEVRDLAVTLSEALQELDEARDRTEAALGRQREFVADASHELRTPLTALIANLEMLAADTDGQSREDAEAALRSGRRMRDLVTDLLLLARSDAEPVEHIAVDLTATVDAVTEEVAPLLSDRTLTSRMGGLYAKGDPAELIHLIRNLVANAINHTPDGTTIRISASGDAERVTVVVEDSGPGIPADLRGRIFERFYREAGDAGGGTGLGLAIAQSIVSDHGGSIAVGESPLGGASFEIDLPAAQASTATATTSGRLRS